MCNFNYRRADDDFQFNRFRANRRQSNPVRRLVFSFLVTSAISRPINVIKNFAAPEPFFRDFARYQTESESNALRIIDTLKRIHK